MRLVSIILLLLAFKSSAQNLLINGDFEEENICSEYKVNCAPEAWLCTVPTFPYYIKDAVKAYHGQHAIAIGHDTKPYYRTYVRSRLLCKLQRGNIYQFQFFIKSVHPFLDSIGVFFSTSDFLFEKQLPYKIKPSLYVVNAQQRPINSKSDWQKVSLLYEATGEENFVTIGNFKRSDLRGPTGIDDEKNFIIFVDDIVLTPKNPNEILYRDWMKIKDEIYAQDERHEYQEQYVKEGKRALPKVKPLTSTITLKVDTLIVPEVLFPSNSYTITKYTVNILDSFCRDIQRLNLDSVIVNGHTDSRGTSAANKELSWRRASTVGAYLQSVLQISIMSRGLGSERPIADNRTSSGRQKNRRVEILLYRKD